MLLLGLFLEVSLPGVVIELGGQEGSPEVSVAWQAGQAGLLLAQVRGHQLTWQYHRLVNRERQAITG